MANFGDELRAAPARAAQEQEAKAKADQARRVAEFLAEQRAIVDDAVQYFKEQCHFAARDDKRSIDCKPDRHNVRGAVYIGNTLTSLLVGKSYARKRAQQLVPEVEKRLSTLGLRSYRVSIIDVATTYPTRYYVGFRIQASW